MTEGLTSACTCPSAVQRGERAVRNPTGHMRGCPRYDEWYRRYAPADAGPYVPADNNPDQLGPPTGPPDDARAFWIIDGKRVPAGDWIGADWPVADPANPDAQLRASQHVAIQLSEVTVENIREITGGNMPPEGEDGDGER